MTDSQNWLSPFLSLNYLIEVIRRSSISIFSVWFSGISFLTFSSWSLAFPEAEHMKLFEYMTAWTWPDSVGQRQVLYYPKAFLICKLTLTFLCINSDSTFQHKLWLSHSKVLSYPCFRVGLSGPAMTWHLVIGYFICMWYVS